MNEPTPKPDFAECVNCSKNAVYMAGWSEPVAWILTEPCLKHKPEPKGS